jgi:hypothetical protein
MIIYNSLLQTGRVVGLLNSSMSEPPKRKRTMYFKGGMEDMANFIDITNITSMTDMT